jgi:CheY-like chemotaxis protein
MSSPKRIVVVDDDDKVRQLIAWYLKPPEFEFFGFGDATAALAKLDEIQPDLIVSDVMMPEMDGRTFFDTVRSREGLETLPFIFASAVRAEPEIEKALREGAAAFLIKPFSVKELVARIRNILAEAPARPQPPAAPLAVIPSASAAGEDSGQSRPEGGSPEPEPLSDDFFGMLLAPSTAPADKKSVPGRFTTLEINGRHVQILTEADNRPNFTVTTLVSQAGQGVRKIETSWRYPLQRQQDLALVKRQVDVQHEQVLARPGDFLTEGETRNILWTRQTGAVDGALLAWAASRVAEDTRLDQETIVTLLRQTSVQQEAEEEALKLFRVNRDGRVSFDRSRGHRMSQAAVSAVAAWTAGFLKAAFGLSEEATGMRIRKVTRMKRDDLDRIGFYDALDAACGGSSRRRASPARRW